MKKKWTDLDWLFTGILLAIAVFMYKTPDIVASISSSYLHNFPLDDFSEMDSWMLYISIMSILFLFAATTITLWIMKGSQKNEQEKVLENRQQSYRAKRRRHR
ncbi:hypothetical protein BMT55_00950 [Listeria newyorkensis]|uniref:Uncharacterized protein n=1 Tax=Listeria newyorkensis TaxID=1497681 RepID=A0ABX4XR34_9LIST|nr:MULTISPECIES: hypothetical protein [Listeria]KGL39104.1 hypothetical protein EP56_14410 [Listeriaceae bacterium FSL A5-0209]KGL43919.1 hypothetical protein EP58_05550 [Listeria newyorkensis]KMT61790.1 hypothetical protein X559_1874 [Listeria newyorkensis]PNP94948.1 hypothetical protein BMT55_00950 [Listeria newyorkensis]RQW66324.1 hypothetical protein DUK53_11465 [Listeria sp. SHR_NRA_18]